MKLYLYIYISSTIIGSSFSYIITLSSLKVIEKTNKFIFCLFDYILYIECKLLFIGFWLCYILQKKIKRKKNERVYINLAIKLNR